MTQTHKAYGLVTGLAIIIVSVILYVADLGYASWGRYVGYVPFIIGLVLNAIAFSKENDHYVKFGQVFSSCFKACAIITLLVLAWSIASIYIFPDIVEKGMEAARIQMEKNPEMTQEQIDTGLAMAKKFFIPFMIAGVVFGYMIIGAIFSLIAAAVPKKLGDRPQNA